jgi:hypothetical protein
MYAQVEKPKENSFPTKRQESRAVANSVAQKKSDGKQGFGFVDNRIESVVQRKLQSMMRHGMVQRQPLALADRPWEEIEELKATFGSEAVLSGKTNNIPTREQIMQDIPQPMTEGGGIVIEEVQWDSITIDKAAAEIGEEWIELPGEVHTKKGEHQCSGDDWTQKDEGVDVANDFQSASERKQDPQGGVYEKTFIARYEEGTEPITVMQIEMRQEDQESPEIPHLYIRWLIGSPVRKGGGSKLVRLAKKEALRVAKGELRVESARSAEEWYKRQGFETRYNSTHESDGEECGCKFMKWDRGWF